LTFHFIPQ